MFAAAINSHGGTVHDITHPQLSGALKGEAAAIQVGGLIQAYAHQAVASQQAMDGGTRKVQLLGHITADKGCSMNSRTDNARLASLIASKRSLTSAGNRRNSPRPARGLGSSASKSPLR
jgi:hypothetical protein